MFLCPVNCKFSTWIGLRKKDPHKSGFPLQNPAFQAARTGIVGVFFLQANPSGKLQLSTGVGSCSVFVDAPCSGLETGVSIFKVPR